MSKKKRAKIKDHPDRISFHEGVLFGLTIGIVSAVLIFISNVLFPHIPDTGLSVGITYFVLFFLFGLAGYRTYRKDKRISSSARAGAMTAFLSFTLIILAFVYVDNMFYPIVSMQSDKVMGFSHSGFDSMRDYINYSLLEGAIFVVPIGSLLGTLFGAIGGYVREATS